MIEKEAICHLEWSTEGSFGLQVEQLEDPRSVVDEIVKRCHQKQLMSLYKVPTFKDSEEFLQSVAFQRGRLLPGGIGDSSSAARVILHDWHNGKIPYYTVPPTRDSAKYSDAQIMDSWREEFNADKVRPFPPKIEEPKPCEKGS